MGTLLGNAPRQGCNVLLPDWTNSFGLGRCHNRDRTLHPWAGCDSHNTHSYKHSTPDGWFFFTPSVVVGFPTAHIELSRIRPVMVGSLTLWGGALANSAHTLI